MSRGIAVLLLIASCAFGADVSGIWSGTLTDRNGDPQDLSFRFSSVERLSGAPTSNNTPPIIGKMYGDNESTPIADFRISGDTITFSVTSELNGQVTKFIYTGVIEGSEMALSRLRADAKPDADGKPPKPQTLRLKRLT